MDEHEAMAESAVDAVFVCGGHAGAMRECVRKKRMPVVRHDLKNRKRRSAGLNQKWSLLGYGFREKDRQAERDNFAGDI